MKRQLFALLLIAAFVACKKENTPAEAETNIKSIAPNGFNFNTTKSVKLDIRLLTNSGQPISGIPVTFHNPANDTELFKSLTDEDGAINTDLTIASYIDKLVVKPDYIGVANQVTAFFSNNTLQLVIGGKKGLEGNFIVECNKDSEPGAKRTQSMGTMSSNYSYMGAYDNDGRPQYLTPSPGTVSASLLDHINASLPDGADVRTHHPTFMANSAKQTLDVVKTGEVFITFVSEGAGLKNAIAYYSYPTNNPPANPTAITTFKYIFPNASGVGSGGAMVSGDRVSLGSFNAGTSIGIVLLSNGWDSSSQSVKSSAEKFYSNKQYNPEADETLKKHIVLLNFAQEDIFVIGIEDLNRQTEPICDHDFNDVVLYADCYPKDAISKLGVVNLDTPKDSDGDGVTDQFDEYPNDPKKAYNKYFPSKTGWGTLAFEDNWPMKGDYDMNDLVINYRYAYVANAGNKIVEMTAEYKVATSLAYFHNGFGVEMPFNSSLVESVTGYVRSKNYISLNPNGTEAGQSKAVLIPFDDQKVVYNETTKESQAVSLKIKFTTPQPSQIYSAAPYNPFLISDGRRSHEIHLPGKTPTDLADRNLFGYQDDLSNPGTGKYYIGTNNWPWALQFTEQFNYPAEGQAVNDAYPNFAPWAASGGTKFTKWYK